MNWFCARVGSSGGCRSIVDWHHGQQHYRSVGTKGLVYFVVELLNKGVILLSVCHRFSKLHSIIYTIHISLLHWREGHAERNE